MRNQKGIAIITGASSGIGHELCKLFARDGYSLLITARGQDALNALAEELRANGAKTTVFSTDLALPDAPQRIFEAAERMSQPVEVLVNNAGFGTYGPFVTTVLEDTLAMMQVNMIALTQLCRLILPQMIERGRGRILNVASTAAFQPGPLMAVYFASKGYVLHFSEAVADELRGTGVTVTALCPGPTETGFKSRAGIPPTWLFRKPRLMNPRQAALVGYHALMRGERLAVPGLRNKCLVQAVRFGPRRIVTAISRLLLKPRGNGHAAEAVGLRTGYRESAHPVRHVS
jgi:short-subunit dehydrogenase